MGFFWQGWGRIKNLWGHAGNVKASRKEWARFGGGGAVKVVSQETRLGCRGRSASILHPAAIFVAMFDGRAENNFRGNDQRIKQIILHVEEK